jgi:hypothetical protein
MRRPPTDFEILREIRDLHYSDYVAHINDPKSAHHRHIYMPVDVAAVAERLEVEAEIVFGRLYYDLDPKYGEPEKEGRPRKVFFTPKAGSDQNCINFPHLEAVLAGLWQQRRRDLLAVWTSAVSLGIALASLFISIFVR